MVIVFFLIAMIYSLVGFGGGSSYLAILALNNVEYSLIPILALICNLIVVSGSSFHYLKNKLVKFNLFYPLIIASAPMAFLGGLYKIDKNTFYVSLIFCLFLVALRILFFKNNNPNEIYIPKTKILLVSGAILGFISGILGLGGGILLSPILLYKKWANAKQTAALSCLFIFINSATGLLGQFYKNDFNIPLLYSYLPLFFAVMIGGQLGVQLSLKKANLKFIEKSTALLILAICFNLLRTL